MSNPSHTTWRDLVDALLKEATGAGLDAHARMIAVRRGADWVEQFNCEHPLEAIFIGALINSSAEIALASLQAVNPDAARIPGARLFIEELQKRLRG